MSVSICIPAYNQPNALARCLESVCQQTYPHLEIIVCDDASPDPTVIQIIEQFQGRDPRIKAYRQTENAGAYWNFDACLTRATGDYILYVGHDDVLKPEAVARMIDGFTENTVAVGAEAQYVVHGRAKPFIREGAAFASPKALETVLTDHYGNLFYSLFRREALYRDGQTIFQWLHPLREPLNELAFFLAVDGNWKVLPDILWHKHVPAHVYTWVHWWRDGGLLPQRSDPGYYARVREDVQTTLTRIGRADLHDRAADVLQRSQWACETGRSPAYQDAPLVTVGIPTHNNSVGLMRALKCWTAQTYTNLEILVSDDGRDKATQTVCAQFPDVQYCQRPGTGVADNFNALIDRATGTFFLWAADDDTYEPDTIAQLVPLLQTNPAAAIAMPMLDNVDDGGVTQRTYPELPSLNHPDRLRYFLLYPEWRGKANLIYGLMRTDWLRHVGGYQTAGVWGGDMLFVFRMLQEGGVVFSERVLFHKTLQIKPEREDWVTYLNGYRQLTTDPAHHAILNGRLHDLRHHGRA